MKKHYVKSKKEYEKPNKLEAEKILAAMMRFKNLPKRPTSVALDADTIKELKEMAMKQGIPYQVLIRVFILDGIKRLKEVA